MVAKGIDMQEFILIWGLFIALLAGIAIGCWSMELKYEKWKSDYIIQSYKSMEEILDRNNRYLNAKLKTSNNSTLKT